MVTWLWAVSVLLTIVFLVLTAAVNRRLHAYLDRWQIGIDDARDRQWREREFIDVGFACQNKGMRGEANSDSEV